MLLRKNNFNLTGEKHMREIQLTQGQVALVDSEDYERLNQFKWYASKQGKGKKFYAVRCIDTRHKDGKYKKIWLHREVMNCPDGMVVDHLSGVGLDCRRSNLEVVTPFENLSRACKKAQATIAAKVQSDIIAFFGEEIAV